MHWVCAFLFLAAAQQVGPKRNTPATVEGYVIHSTTGEPVLKAHVSLESASAGHDSELIATTDQTGRFRFADIQPGIYMLMAQKSGFLPGGYRQTGPNDQMSLLKISAADRLHDIALHIFPAGAIGGRVLDADGDPISGERVTLWTQRRRRKDTPYSPGEETTTNHDGEYQFDELLPGTYFVSAESDTAGHVVRQIPVDSSGEATRIHDLTTFYPAALSLADAQSVTVQSGEELSDIDIRIQRGPLLSVKGRITEAVNLSAYKLSADVEEGLGWTSEAAKILPNGKFVFEALPPGKHRLALMKQGVNGWEEAGFSEINLTDEDLTGVVITPFTPARVSVRVMLEGEDKLLTTGSVSLDSVDGNAPKTQQQFQPQNSVYIFNDVPPGRYRVWFNNARDYYLKSVKSGSQSIDPGAIEIGEGAKLDLLMIFSRNVASITGDVGTPPDSSDASVRVLLISEEPRSEFDRIWPAELDQSLHFSLERMPPGKYLAFAVEENDFDVWDSQDFIKLLEEEGVEVELHESEHATIHLKLIPKDVTDRIRRQLGI